MRILLALLLTVPLGAQSPQIPAKAEWVGPLEFHDYRGLNIVPTRVTLDFDNGKLTGRWSALSKHASGDIEGTVTPQGRVRVKVTVNAGAEVPLPNGSTQTVALERCSGTETFEGYLTAASVFRWTAKRIRLDTPVKRLQEKACENMTDLVWTLQPH